MIHVTDLSVCFGALTALDGVTLDFRKGEFTVLLGRSGAGKSSLLRCLNHLQIPSRGTVNVNGLGPLSVRRNLRQHRRRTGMIFQLHHLMPGQTALQNVLAGRLGYHSTLRSLFPPPRDDFDRAIACLERVGLLSRALAKVEQLSGGERQRVGIARALCQEPTVLLADEPVASLDPATGDEVMSLLARICREEQLTPIVSLHQLAFARRYGERIVGLAAGRVVFDGRPESLGEEHLRAIYADTAHELPEAPASLPHSPAPLEERPDDEARILA
jgi:phosphonate transport system ATP-binding protein